MRAGLLTLLAGLLGFAANAHELTLFLDGVPSESNEHVFKPNSQVQVAFGSFPLADKIVYSLDGNDPLEFGETYSSPFLVSNSVVIRAMASFIGPTHAVTNAPVTLKFAETFILTTSASMGGEVYVTNGPGPFASNTVVSVVASNYPGYSFAGWMGDLEVGSVTRDGLELAMDRHREVRALFRLTDSSEQSTAGGPLRLAANTGVGQVAYVQVHIGPPGAVADGAGWLFTGQTNYSSNPNFTVAVLSNQVASIVFKPVPGWATPLSTMLSVPLGQLTVYNANYRSNILYLQVLLGPQAAIDAGAGWRLFGQGSYHTNAETTIEWNISTNPPVLEFQAAPGWIGPPVRTLNSINLVGGWQSVVHGDYSVSRPTVSLLRPPALRLDGTTNTSYRIEYRTNLNAGDWLPLMTTTIGASGSVIAPLSLTNGATGFYRAVWLP